MAELISSVTVLCYNCVAWGQEWDRIWTLGARSWKMQPAVRAVRTWPVKEAIFLLLSSHIWQPYGTKFQLKDVNVMCGLAIFQSFSLLGELSQFPPGGPPPFYTTHAGLSLGTISVNKSDIIGFKHTLFFLKSLKTCVRKTENSILKLQTTFLQNSFYYICPFFTITAEIKKWSWLLLCFILLYLKLPEHFFSLALNSSSGCTNTLMTMENLNSQEQNLTSVYHCQQK